MTAFVDARVVCGERTGVLVLRVWIEAGARAGEGLRARITSEQQLGSGDRVTVAAATVDEIVSIVREWLEGFAAGPVTRR